MIRRTFFLAAACVALVSCSRPQPPTIAPKSAKLTNISLEGVDLDVELVAYNPNSIDLEIKSVTAKVVLDHKIDAGTFTEARPVTLPAKKSTNVSVPMKVHWTDAIAVASLASQNRNIDYEIEGSAEIGGDVLRLNLPFKVTGTVTHAEMVKAVQHVVPGLPHIPGLIE